MRLTGNRGEWSELYALLKLLSLGRLYAADEHANRLDDVYFPLLRILRDKDSCGKIEFIVNGNLVELHVNGNKRCTFPQTWFDAASSIIYNGILLGGTDDGAFAISDAPAIMNQLEIDRITASSEDKTDITMQLHDIHTGYDPIYGFSIKSQLGNAPSLLNASRATNFVYRVEDMTDSEMQRINSIHTRTKIIDRVLSLSDNHVISFLHAADQTFSENLAMIDSKMEVIISEMLIDYYRGNSSDCEELISRLEERNPLHFPRTGFYGYKFRKFLAAAALGMKPSTQWDGKDEANGGYVIVKDDGDVVAYHIYNRESFEFYLLHNTKLEKGSSTRHGFATVYKQGDEYRINLNLQVRFKT